MRLTGGLLEAGPGKERRKEVRLCLGRRVVERGRGAALAPQAGQGLRAEGAAHSEGELEGGRERGWKGGQEGSLPRPGPVQAWSTDVTCTALRCEEGERGEVPSRRLLFRVGNVVRCFQRRLTSRRSLRQRRTLGSSPSLSELRPRGDEHPRHFGCK